MAVTARRTTSNAESARQAELEATRRAEMEAVRTESAQRMQELQAAASESEKRAVALESAAAAREEELQALRSELEVLKRAFDRQQEKPPVGETETVVGIPGQLTSVLTIPGSGGQRVEDLAGDEVGIQNRSEPMNPSRIDLGRRRASPSPRRTNPDPSTRRNHSDPHREELAATGRGLGSPSRRRRRDRTPAHHGRGRSSSSASFPHASPDLERGHRHQPGQGDEHPLRRRSRSRSRDHRQATLSAGADSGHQPNQRIRLSNQVEDRLMRLLYSRGGALENAQEQAEQAKQNLARMTSTPFIREIRNQPPPAKFSSPTFELYDGKADPVNHVAIYSHKMELWIDNEALMCKMFPATLGKTALKWFHSLRADSIYSWSHLAKAFVSRFIANSREPTSVDSLYALKIRRDEGLRKFAARFMDCYSDIGDCDEKSAIGAFRLGLGHGCKLRESLTLMTPTNVSELQERVRQYVKLEDDYKSSRDKEPRCPNRRKDNPDHGRERSLRPPHTQVVHTIFKIPIHKMLNQIKDKHFFRWPAPLRQDVSERDQSKFCYYHREKGHMTTDCKAYKRFLEQMVEKGHLQDFLANGSGAEEGGGMSKSADEHTPTTHPPRKVIH